MQFFTKNLKKLRKMLPLVKNFIIFVNMVKNLKSCENIGLTPVAAKLLQKELETRKSQGYSASKTGIASEAIIKAYGRGEGV